MTDQTGMENLTDMERALWGAIRELHNVLGIKGCGFLFRDEDDNIGVIRTFHDMPILRGTLDCMAGSWEATFRAGGVGSPTISLSWIERGLDETFSVSVQRFGQDGCVHEELVFLELDREEFLHDFSGRLAKSGFAQADFSRRKPSARAYDSQPLNPDLVPWTVRMAIWDGAVQELARRGDRDAWESKEAERLADDMIDAAFRSNATLSRKEWNEIGRKGIAGEPLSGKLAEAVAGGEAAPRKGQAARP